MVKAWTSDTKVNPMGSFGGSGWTMVQVEDCS